MIVIDQIVENADGVKVDDASSIKVATKGLIIDLRNLRYVTADRSTSSLSKTSSRLRSRSLLFAQT